MRLGRAAFEHHDFDDPQCDNAKDAGKQDAGKEQPGATGLERLSRRPLGDDRGAGRRLEMPRPAWVVVVGLKRLGCDHHRLVMIWAIKSSSDFARRGGLAAGLHDRLHRYGLGELGRRRRLLQQGRHHPQRALRQQAVLPQPSRVAGSGARTGTPSGALGAVLAAGSGSAAATTRRRFRTWAVRRAGGGRAAPAAAGCRRPSCEAALSRSGRATGIAGSSPRASRAASG